MYGSLSHNVSIVLLELEDAGGVEVAGCFRSVGLSKVEMRSVISCSNCISCRKRAAKASRQRLKIVRLQNAKLVIGYDSVVRGGEARKPLHYCLEVASSLLRPVLEPGLLTSGFNGVDCKIPT
jgi:hypothetical protein